MESNNTSLQLKRFIGSAVDIGLYAIISTVIFVYYFGEGITCEFQTNGSCVTFLTPLVIVSVIFVFMWFGIGPLRGRTPGQFIMKIVDVDINGVRTNMVKKFYKLLLVALFIGLSYLITRDYLLTTILFALLNLGGLLFTEGSKTLIDIITRTRAVKK